MHIAQHTKTYLAQMDADNKKKWHENNYKQFQPIGKFILESKKNETGYMNKWCSRIKKTTTQLI